jgi:prepilin-type N-terminal cleavage/methylation domain-containing protein
MNHPSRAGVTLMELLIVVALISLLVGVSFPTVSAGIDSLRLAGAADSIAAFLNGALNRAERRQEVVEVSIWRQENRLSLRSTAPGFQRELPLPEGIQIVTVLPELPDQFAGETGPRRFLLLPGSTVPRVGIVLANARGARRTVRIDPITGPPQVEAAEQP